MVWIMGYMPGMESHGQPLSLCVPVYYLSDCLFCPVSYRSVAIQLHTVFLAALGLLTYTLQFSVGYFTFLSLSPATMLAISAVCVSCVCV